MPGKFTCVMRGVGSAAGTSVEIGSSKTSGSGWAKAGGSFRGANPGMVQARLAAKSTTIKVKIGFRSLLYISVPFTPNRFLLNLDYARPKLREFGVTRYGLS